MDIIGALAVAVKCGKGSRYKGNAFRERKRKDFPSKWYGKPRFGKHTDFYSRINEMKIVRSECRDAFYY